MTLLFWLASFVFCSSIYGFGEIIKLLTIISEKEIGEIMIRNLEVNQSKIIDLNKRKKINGSKKS